MVEGDGCHRTAAAHRQSLVRRKFSASSPNGRFRAGAKAIVSAGGVLLRIEVHGKNLFYFFGKAGKEPTVVMHVHFGMSGIFAVYRKSAPETTPNTRLRLETVDGKGAVIVAHLSAMIVKHGTFSTLYVPTVMKLGPDPLRKDAKPDAFFARCAHAKKKPIGSALMDQSFLAGVGNIYRSECLYEARIHPNQLSNTVTQKEMLVLWGVIVKQMQAGFKSGSIWGNKSGPLCYSRKTSGCGGKVRRWTMGGRFVCACAKRQRLDAKRRPVITTPKPLKTGTKHLGKMVPAAIAEDRKRKSGEGLAVQHVALKDDATRAGDLRAAALKRKRARKA